MRRSTIGTLALAIALIGALASPAAAQPSPGGSPGRHVVNGETQPIYSRADAVTQTVHVETTVDSDRDGKRDRVEMRIIRPKETDQNLKVPTVVEPSPYWAGTLDIPNHDVDIDAVRALGATNNKKNLLEAAGSPFPGIYDNFLLPRGYAIAQVDSVGTGGSTGCPTSGARNEQAGARAAVDWLTGRAKGWNPDGSPALARWSTGNVGMIGQSYNGTLPNMAAATGVRGLKAIVPIAGISDWYDYYRAGGGVVAPGGFQGEDLDVLAKLVYTRDDREICKPIIDEIAAKQDRVTGDFSPFWAEREYVSQARNVEAAVMVVHGLNDWNVKVKNSVQWWNALKKAGVPLKLWLHQANHATPLRWRTEEWLRQIHHWFDRFLYGIQNGITSEPRVDVERGPGVWERYRDWPIPGTRTVPLSLNAGPAGQPGALSLVPRPGGTQSLIDAGRTRKAEELAADFTQADPNRLIYTTGALPAAVRMNGIPQMTTRASLDGRSPYLTALLVDYGTDARTTGTRRSTGEQVCFGQVIPEDQDGCQTRTELVTEVSPFKIVTRGWLDANNRHDRSRTEPIEPGKMYDFRWSFEPSDYVFKKGHRLGVVVLSTDFDYTLRYPAGTKLAMQPGISRLLLPVALGGNGGNSAFG